MNRRTRAIIAATVVVLGIGVVALGYFEDESSVRYVADLHTDADAHSDGSYTLLGIPQPETLPGDRPNPEYDNAVVSHERATDGDRTLLITRTTTVEQTAPGKHTFTVNTTTRATDSNAVIDESTTTWTLEGDVQVFQVDDFETGQTVWAAFGGVLNGDIQPKPSQLQGHLAPHAPSGLLLWMVEPDGYTVGCSSKFLPDEVADEYDADGDGYTD